MNARLPVAVAPAGSVVTAPAAVPIVAQRNTTVLVCALGGEGGGVLAEWLYAAAVRAGYAAQSTSIPGVAQRTGATTYYIEVHPQPLALLGAQRPSFSLNAVPGAIDLLVSSELLETVRQVGNGYADAQRTRVISSTARALTVAEKMQPTDGRADSAALEAVVRQHSAHTQLLDLAAMAQETDSAISAVLFGAIAASGVLPFDRNVFEDTIRHTGKGVQPSLRGFARSFEATAATAKPAAAPAKPSTAPDFVQLGRARVASYQDEAYARLFDQRLQRVREANAADANAGVAANAVVNETARWLALWMAFDDTVRVAELKLARSRLARVRAETGARPDEVVKLYEHFKPGAPELAALLPGALAQRLLAWDRKRVNAGREPWALPLKLATHTVAGALALKLMASMKGLRQRGSRFALEQSLIERWLNAVVQGTQQDGQLGLELARCGRLVKGYGSTNERGKSQLLHIVDELAARVPFASAAQRAQAVAQARTAAFSDDAGLALDRTLHTLGAAKRPVAEHTVRWFKRRPQG
jgi:indolepyruvate ferredoxin oxidoreductase, beta subunit